MVDSSQHVSLSEAKDPAAPGATTPGSFASLRLTAWWISSLPVRLLDAAIWLYQRTLSPALNALSPHCGCRFAPTCSHYARGALREHGLFAGIALTLVRLAKCGPWHPGGDDPVPPRKLTCVKVTPPSLVKG